ncbi:hypothetical protein OCU04_008934 [Sclerotinia nivalis]|uniref:Uncharacterized protein n=1 Tax=Sclerotinia nivalis TaxID=352851 RepID=A0A9X0AHN3_9HELO|nr:hypothetical protein OCU04_008934 [Sclerotinia nivalis]
MSSWAIFPPQWQLNLRSTRHTYITSTNLTSLPHFHLFTTPSILLLLPPPKSWSPHLIILSSLPPSIFSFSFSFPLPFNFQFQRMIPHFSIFYASSITYYSKFSKDNGSAAAPPLGWLGVSG